MSMGSSFRVRLEDGPDSAAPGSADAPARSFRERRRNRHGRGLRGDLIPPHLAGARTRAERFDEWVLESAQRLERLWGEQIQSYQFLVEEIPPDLEELARSGGPIPLGAGTPAGPNRPPVITIYRHAVETAAHGLVPVSELLHDVIVEQLAGLMGMDPETIDPAYGRYRPL
ncbi:metallopeptidase family protein [Arthrobacter zhangbolii]|uniref:Metallopeptidase family protein n=1 Tax=Arthrobacter zhangbolii TaxID=2886936 RepID=A0A9X1M8R6_9MICC|nr:MULTISPECIES: metallopeptidase family protein [Arthrobacter]MCC3272930.1 metallopeptidase family protein [Arthrobacter zhangbolii]MDN3905298.1 metallopeptidase family protein [Arthrobacter sp. YD2]UON92983.1 metallopeptidase family protein [Arthrobacter zhangbolii]